MKRLTFFVAVGFAIFSCINVKESSKGHDVAGAYAREHTFRLTNPESGADVGMRTIRDTIFIRQVDDDFEVSNNKWMLNDYDKVGWQNMEHADDRPLPSYRAQFEANENSLRTEFAPPLFLDFEAGVLFRGKKGENPYVRIP